MSRTLPGGTSAASTVGITTTNPSSEDIKLVPPTDQTVNGVVTSIIFMGVHYEIRLKGDDGFEWLIQSIHSAEVGSRLGIHLDPDDIHIMDRSQYDTAESLEIKQ